MALVDFTEVPRTRLRQQMQAAVQSIQWTYSVFWQFSHPEGLLVWMDGFYNGGIKTRKTVQPMELSPEELCAQRSLQLRELFESLSAGETNPPTRRPCAALSPEDLTESEWFYLMCMSFTFAPGVGLPGRALTKRHHVWLSQANEADSKLFSRAILAKSARIQTVACIPLADGVLEIGSTELIREDIGLIHQVTSLLADHSKPVCSEQSTSNPHSENASRALPPDQLSMQPPDGIVFEEQNVKATEYNSDNAHENAHIPMQVSGLQSEKTVTEFGQNGSEVMQLDMSPEDCSNDIGSELQVTGGNSCMQVKHSTNAWPDISHGLQSSGTQQYLDQGSDDESGHYSKTVSTILQQQRPSQWTETTTLQLVRGNINPQDITQRCAFSCWTGNGGVSIQKSMNPQWVLKYILFSVPNLHSRDRDESSPKLREGENGCRVRRSGQDDITVNHVLAERRRREKLNERFIILRTLVPFVTKMDKASILGDAIEYVKQLRRRIQDLEVRSKQMEAELKKSAEPRKQLSTTSQEKIVRQRSGGTTNNNNVDQELVSSCRNFSDHSDQQQYKISRFEKRKIRVLERSEPLTIIDDCSTDVQVSIIEHEALVELQCPWREGLLLDIMQTLSNLLFETHSVQSSVVNNTFVAKIRAKVKAANIGEKPTITKVKNAVLECIPSRC